MNVSKLCIIHLIINIKIMLKLLGINKQEKRKQMQIFANLIPKVKVTLSQKSVIKLKKKS